MTKPERFRCPAFADLYRRLRDAEASDDTVDIPDRYVTFTRAGAVTSRPES